MPWSKSPKLLQSYRLFPPRCPPKCAHPHKLTLRAKNTYAQWSRAKPHMNTKTTEEQKQICQQYMALCVRVSALVTVLITWTHTPTLSNPFSTNSGFGKRLAVCEPWYLHHNQSVSGVFSAISSPALEENFVVLKHLAALLNSVSHELLRRSEKKKQKAALMLLQALAVLWLQRAIMW